MDTEVELDRAILAKKQGSSNKSKHEEQMGDIAAMIAAKYGGKSSGSKKRSGKKNKGKENKSVWSLLSFLFGFF